MSDTYVSPLSTRYASAYMLELFSQTKRIRTWRRLWVSLARAEHALGLPVTEDQVKELEEHVDDIDFDAAAAREKEVRHDVMAHVYAYGLAAPGAAGVIHLGATSCYVTDNADLILYRDGLRYLRDELLRHRQRGPDHLPRRSALPARRAAEGDPQPGGLCRKV